MKIVTFATGKGGVGKSTSAVAVAHKMASRGHHTLLADFDRQGSASKILGFDPWDGTAKFVEHAQQPYLSTSDMRALETQTIRSAHNIDLGFEQERDGLELMSGSNALLAIERTKLTGGEPVQHAARALRWMWDQMGYEVIVIDTHPGYWFYELGVYLSDCLVIPTALDFLALDEIGGTLGTVRDIGAEPSGVIILPVFDRGFTEDQDNLKQLHQLYPDQVAEPVPYSQAVRESAAYGATVWEYKSRLDTFARTKERYSQLVDEWLIPCLTHSPKKMEAKS